MAPPEKTEPLPVCVDADVLIAGLLSRTGASHAILVLGEVGLLRLVTAGVKMPTVFAPRFDVNTASGDPATSAPATAGSP